uniref:hypothetical protein n=1 Tax=Dissulfurispira sp. TaxID=2817609 RepID=UPI002FD9C97E
MHKDLVIYYMVGVFSTLTISAIAYGISRLRNYNPSSRLIYALIGLSVYMPIAQYLKLNSLHSYVDFSHWLQVLYSLSVSGKPLSLKEFYKAAIETKAERGAKG